MIGIEEGIVYLLTNVSIANNYVIGSGSYSKPYCKLGDVNSLSAQEYGR